MKAVVMAGGEGTRLRPLTINRPKPMIPVVNRPVMEHIVRLVKQHGMNEVIATLHFLPDAIQEYFGDGSEFGVKMKYSVEVTPLGTAGSVRQAADELRETFLVISGDALTDMDLSDLIRFHKEKGAVATLALTRVQNPLDFGVVITDGSGRITRFLEKPSWSEVFSDTINTGIYVLEPEIFSLMEEGKVYDFSKDIFPKLLATGRPIYGYVSKDYWCDIGSLDQCRQAQEDCLAGRVKVSIPGEEVQLGIWLGRGVSIDPTAQITAPVVIGDGVVIRPGARVGEFSALGTNTVIDREAEVKRTCTMGQVYIGSRAEVRGSILTRGASVGQRSMIGQGAVIGDGTQIGEYAIIKPGIKIWPHKTVEAGAQVNSTIIWGSRHTKALFGPEGVSGLGNIDITPEMAVRLGEAFGTTLAKGDAVCVSRDLYFASVMLKRSIMAGLASAGIRVFNLESLSLPLTRHAISTLGAKGGVFVMASPQTPGGVTLKFLDSRGTDIDTGTERKIETMMVREDTRKVPVDEIGQVLYPSKVVDAYRTDFLNHIDMGVVRRRQFKVVIDYGHGAAVDLAPALLGVLGIQDLSMNAAHSPGQMSRTDEERQTALEHTAGMVRAVRADLGIVFDAPGERLRLVDNKGRILSGQQALTLFARLVFDQRQEARVAVPVTATGAIEQLAGQFGSVRRTKTGARSLMQVAASAQRPFNFLGDTAGGYIFPEFSPALDGMFATAQLLYMLAQAERPLDQIVDTLPPSDVLFESVNCPLETKGTVMRHLIEATAGRDVELLDGVKVRSSQSWVALIPDPVRPLMHIYSEPGHEARGLVHQYRAVVERAIAVGMMEQSAATVEEKEEEL